MLRITQSTAIGAGPEIGLALLRIVALPVADAATIIFAANRSVPTACTDFRVSLMVHFRRLSNEPHCFRHHRRIVKKPSLCHKPCLRSFAHAVVRRGMPSGCAKLFAGIHMADPTTYFFLAQKTSHSARVSPSALKKVLNAPVFGP